MKKSVPNTPHVALACDVNKHLLQATLLDVLRHGLTESGPRTSYITTNLSVTSPSTTHSSSTTKSLTSLDFEKKKKVREQWDKEKKRHLATSLRIRSSRGPPICSTCEKTTR
ncbi:hypothetical protein TNCV_2338761 [Trichonephila clavipes]|nr:hypothetical protein TNCV_2338761 [Trichonephila clavipes]